MTVANWANWCMIIETVGAVVVIPLFSAFWHQHKTIRTLRELVHKLERELDKYEKDVHRPHNG